MSGRERSLRYATGSNKLATPQSRCAAGAGSPSRAPGEQGGFQRVAVSVATLRDRSDLDILKMADYMKDHYVESVVKAEHGSFLIFIKQYILI